MSNNLETIETNAARIAAVGVGAKADKQPPEMEAKQQPAANTRSRRIRGDVPDFVFYGPALALFVVFVLFPIISSFGIAFTIWDGITTPRWVGLDNFAQLFSDHSVLVAIANTLKYASVFIVVNNALAFLLALGLNEVRWGRTLLRGIFFLPVLISGVVVALSWQFILNPVYGPLDTFFRDIGLKSLALNWLTDPNLAMWVIIAVGIWQSVGSATVIYLAGLQSVPREYYEAAQIDGASGFRQRWHITIPLVAPVVTINVVLSLIGALRVFDPVWLLTKGNPVGLTDVMATKVYKVTFVDQRFGYGAALSVLLTLATMIAAVFVLRYMLKREEQQ